MTNLGKSLLGLAFYAPLCAVYVVADNVAGRTEKILNWFEKDLVPPGDVDGPVDGDNTDEFEEPDYTQYIGPAMKAFLDSLKMNPLRNPENV